ncbi:MAG: GNAT family N-acetyltransferase [Deltaproteobacteria bacterium]|nr:GNAT family N-acetyltransferase [Deltaproteobacteria bacterium]
MSYLIRDAQIEDSLLLAGLIRTSFQDVARRFSLTEENAPRHPSNCTQEWVTSALERGVRHYVLETGEAACGCVALEQISNEVCYLERLCVLPGFRGQGFGSNLVNHVIDAGRGLKAHRLEIGIIAADTHLRNWYEHLGFTQTHTALFAHLPFEVAFMELELK